MISTVAFANIGPNSVRVRRVDITPELETSLGLCRLGASMRQMIDETPVEEGDPSGNGVQQHLYLVHSTTARIEFPSFDLKGDFSLSGVLDVDVSFDCLGICFYESRRSRNAPPLVHDGNETVGAPGIGDQGSGVAQDTALDIKVAEDQGRSVRRQAPPRFVEQFHNFLRDSGTLGGDGVLKIVSKYEVRAVLLVEPPANGGESRMRLYADTVGGDEA